MASLRVDGLTINFGTKRALADVSFAIAAGERLGLIGDSGAGKTLIARALLDLLPPGAEATGSILVNEQRLGEHSARLRGRVIGAIFADASDSLDPLQTGTEQLHEALGAIVDNKQRTQNADALLVEVGLAPLRAALLPEQMDPGERQRLAVALTLASRPEILVADEPTSHLDLIGGRTVLDLIASASRERGMSLLLIARDLKAIAMMCERIAVLKDGRIVETGNRTEVFGHPRHDYTRAVLTAGRYRARALMRAPIGGTLLDVRNVSRRYRRRDLSLLQPQPPIVALDDVSFTMRIGESLAVVGPSRSGKTTLGRIVAGLERASRGELEFDSRIYHGSDLVPVNRGDIAMVPADAVDSFDPGKAVGASLADALRLRAELPTHELDGRLAEALEGVGLSAAILDRRPTDCSPSDLHRLAIARTLVVHPKLVVLDEPVAALDVGARGEILVALDRLRADYGLTLLVTSHDFETIRVIADRAIVLDRGRIVETGTPAQLLERPQHDVTKRLIAAQLPEIGIVPVF